tara:strand:+ start:758 stop:940 length:183 start_codon:yes stop_codon:yes gene_type:complete
MSAQEDLIQISPEMRKAGLDELRENVEKLLYDPEALVSGIYLMMEIERRDETNTTKAEAQ